jgi:hypothetical protein
MPQTGGRQLGVSFELLHDREVERMSPELKDWFQVGAWFAAIIGGLIAAFKAVAEMQRSNAQRREDMRWKRAEMAKQCLQEMWADTLVISALKMLDWSNLQYDVPGGGKTGRISHEARRHSLRVSEPPFRDGDERFVRDAFDALFDSFQLLEHFLRIELIIFDDVQGPLIYYASILAGPSEYPTMLAFLDAYGYRDAHKFLNRFSLWASRAANAKS